MQNAQYQLQDLSAVAQDDSDIERIIELVKGVRKKDLVSVIGKIEIADAVLRTEHLVFHDNSELVFTNHESPFLIIAARNLKFNAPAMRSAVRLLRYNVETLKGEAGAAGADGAAGKPGTDGSAGGDGETVASPDIFFLIENVDTDFGEVTTIDWEIRFPGVRGGQGGDGGRGGNGGAGAKGKTSSSGPGFCRRGGGNGGRGGDSGRGGQGGKGGDGGDGSNVYLVGPKQSLDRLVYSKFLLEGGGGGEAGIPGSSGIPGNGGAGGRGSRHCSGGKAGKGGTQLSDFGRGLDGAAGSRGEVGMIVRSIDVCF